MYVQIVSQSIQNMPKDLFESSLVFPKQTEMIS